VTIASVALASAALVGVVAAPPAAPVVSLSASPARLALAGGAEAPVTLRNFGRSAVLVRVRSGSVVLDVRGRPALARGGAQSAASWLRVRPQRVELRPGEARTVKVRSAVPRAAGPGDHHAVILLTTAVQQRGRLGVRMRVAVRVVVRVPGRVVRRLAVIALQVRRRGHARILDVRIANRGNVTEVLAPGRVAVALLVRGRIASRVRTDRREFLPHSYGIATGRYVGRLRGRVLARVEARGARPRAFWIRL
jgi:hypothetical protein